MASNSELISLFFSDLKNYNSNNFRIIEKADLSKEDARVFKSCSSVVTRYFIFRERHPEVSDQDMKILYYRLGLDQIARYFSEYPSACVEDLKPFQQQLICHVEREKRTKQEATD